MRADTTLANAISRNPTGIRSRIHVMSLIAVLLFAIGLTRGLIQDLFGAPAVYTDADGTIATSRILVFASVGLVLSLAFEALLLLRPMDDDRLELSGLTLGVLCAGILAAIETAIPITPLSAIRPGWTGLWIFTFPMLVGSRLGRTAFALALAVAAQGTVRLVAISGSHDYLAEGISNVSTALTALMALGPVLLHQSILRWARTVEDKAKEFGSYVLRERIGQGGMGEVYRAEHKFLRRDAAVKLVRSTDRPTADQARVLQAFELEAQITASLSSPHTVALYDFGDTPEGGVYYVMEYLEGADLQTLVDRFGALPPERVVHLLGHICDSLGEAHEAGLVHRDIKPANLFVTHRPRQPDHLKVLDFGLARFTDSVVGSHKVVGTPAWMSPELFEGLQPCPAADMYAVGCVAWTLLSGTRPFLAESIEGYRTVHREHSPDPAVLSAEFDPPQDLVRLIQELLSKTKEKRPTADETVERLRGIAFDRGWSPERANRWWGLHLPAGRYTDSMEDLPTHSLLGQRTPADGTSTAPPLTPET